MSNIDYATPIVRSRTRTIWRNAFWTFCLLLLLAAGLVVTHEGYVISQAITATKAATEQRERAKFAVTLVRLAKQEVYDSRYAEAAAICQQILALDQTNNYAKGVMPLLKSQIEIQQKRLEYVASQPGPTTRPSPVSDPRYIDMIGGYHDWPDISERRSDTATDHH